MLCIVTFDAYLHAHRFAKLGVFLQNSSKKTDVKGQIHKMHQFLVEYF